MQNEKLNQDKDDKELFQETAQKLINYASANKSKYQSGGYALAYGTKIIYAHRVVLALYIALHIYAYLHGFRVSVFDNMFFLVLFAILYMRFLKKIDEKRMVQRKRKDILENEVRTECMKTLNMLMKKHPEWEVEPWWTARNGMEYTGYYEEKQMVYYPLPLVVENEKGKKVVQGERNTTANLVSGTEINEKLQSGNCKRLNLIPTDYDAEEKYGLAGVYLYSSSENYDYYYETVNSADTVREEMADYRAALDKKESSRNFWSESGYYETNTDKHLRRSMDIGKSDYDWHEDVNDWFLRQQKEEKRRFDLENEKREIRYISSYTHKLYFVGYFVWKDDDISDILLSSDHAILSKYETRREEFLDIQLEYELETQKKILPMPTLSVISKLEGFRLGEMDYTSKRPQEFTMKQWAAWIYAHVPE